MSERHKQRLIEKWRSISLLEPTPGDLKLIELWQETPAFMLEEPDENGFYPQ